MSIYIIRRAMERTMDLNADVAKIEAGYAKWYWVGYLVCFVVGYLVGKLT